jgi:hypothetical protein
MLTRDDIRTEREPGGIANIYCQRCDAHLGRIQLEPPSDEDNWDAKVGGEIEVLVSEHREFCPQTASALREVQSSTSGTKGRSSTS